MNNDEGSLIEQASILFAQEQYQLAKTLYEKAGNKYGSHLFKANIWLCEKRMAQTENGENTVTVPPPSFVIKDANSSSSAEEQLQETQEALEKYFFEAQDLRNQLSD